MDDQGQPHSLRWPTKTFVVSRLPIAIIGAICTMGAGSGYYVVCIVMKYPAGSGPDATYLFFPCLLLLVGVVALLGSKFAAADNLELNDTSIRYIVKGQVKTEIQYHDVTSVENRYQTAASGAQVNRGKPTGYALRDSQGTVIEASNLYPDFQLMQAMLAERVPSQYVPEEWHKAFQTLR